MENHLMGKLTISMAIFNSYVKLPEGNLCSPHFDAVFQRGDQARPLLVALLLVIYAPVLMGLAPR
jgi:hypothetical protein